MKSKRTRPVVLMSLITLVTAMLGMSAHGGIQKIITVQPVNFMPTEGITFSNQTVATFTDWFLFDSLTSYGLYPSNYQATIDWGDGTAQDTGALAKDGIGNIEVIGGHTYVQEGNYKLSVLVSNVVDGRTGSNSLALQVVDAPLTGYGRDLAATEGAAFNGVVAQFSDANPYTIINEFRANINWGDGTTNAGVIQADGSLFNVIGTHTYSGEGSVPVSVVIYDEGGSQTSAGGTMTVSDAALTATGVTITANEGAPFTALVATFTDANPLATANDFTASIYWGDKTPCSEGEISLSGDNFTVTGSHIYTDEGSHAIIVRIHDVGGSSVSAGSTAQIGDAALSAEGLTVPVIEGTSFSKPVAVFSDANPYGTTEDFTATIDWGDGTTNSGVIVANGSEFYVIGTYMYPDENSEESHGITVSISDIGGSTASAGTTVSVSDAPLTASGMTLPAVEGAPFTNVVAGFTDANPLAATNDFTATIDWGDGSNPSVGLIGINEGGFTVIGSHTYVEEQTYAVNVSIADVGGSQTSAGTTVQVTDAPLTAIGREITPIEDASFVAVVASFLDANPYANTNDFSASIIWGDGITSSGTIVDLGINGFAVMGSHTYTNQGLYFMTVTINDTGGSTATVDSLANTGDALLTGSGTTIAAVQGVAFTNVVANCSDSDASPEQGTEFDCIINWGDGQTTTGTMSEGNEESYSVIGSHTYAQAGSYNILVTVDDPLTMESTSIRSTAVVTAPPAQNVTPQFAIKASRPRLNKRTGLYQQEVTIKNVSKQPVAGPISLVLDNLSSGSGTLSSSSSSVKLMNRDGTILSTGAAPLGSPYRNVSLPKSNVFKGQTARSVVLILQSPSPAITYNTRVLAGPGAR